MTQSEDLVVTSLLKIRDNFTDNRGVFITQSNTMIELLCENSQQHRAVDYFRKALCHRCWTD